MKINVLRVVCNILYRAPDIDTVCFMKQRLHKDQVTVVVYFVFGVILRRLISRRVNLFDHPISFTHFPLPHPHTTF